MKRCFLPVLSIAGAALFLVCGPSQSPYTNPADAKIIINNSLQSLDAQSDSLKVGTTVKCTVEVYLPKLIDSFYVHLSRNGSDSIIASGAVTGASFNFPLSVSVPGVYGLTVVVVKTDKSVDSLPKTITVYAMVPVVVPDTPSYTIYLPADSFTFRFTVTDPDSNVRFAYTWIDTAIGNMDTTPFPALKPFHETFTRTINKNMLLAGLHAPIVCEAYALDADSQLSEVAKCTLFVFDTTSPLITLLSPANINDTITTLPVIIRALVSDVAGINSATFNGALMVIKRNPVSFNDTLIDTVSSLDTGKHTDSIVAVDIVGNKGKLFFPLIYRGKQLYRPEIKELSRATTEGHAFPPILLDTCVIINDPSIVNAQKYAHDSLLWEIRDSTGSLLAYDLNSHMFNIPFPADTEWAGTIKLTFKVWIISNSALSDTKQPLFFFAEVWDPPVITLVNQIVFGAKTPFNNIYLDTITTVRAPDNAPSSLLWSFKNGNHFKVNYLCDSKICLLRLVRRIAIVPLTPADSSWIGTDTLTFTVTDPAHSLQPTVKQILFTRRDFIILPPILPGPSTIEPTLPKRSAR